MTTMSCPLRKLLHSVPPSPLSPTPDYWTGMWTMWKTDRSMSRTPHTRRRRCWRLSMPIRLTFRLSKKYVLERSFPWGHGEFNPMGLNVGAHPQKFWEIGNKMKIIIHLHWALWCWHISFTADGRQVQFPLSQIHLSDILGGQGSYQACPSVMFIVCVYYWGVTLVLFIFPVLLELSSGFANAAYYKQTFLVFKCFTLMKVPVFFRKFDNPVV